MQLSGEPLGPLRYVLIDKRRACGERGGVAKCGNITYVCFAIVVAVAGVAVVVVVGVTAVGDAIGRGHCLQFHVAI